MSHIKNKQTKKETKNTDTQKIKTYQNIEKQHKLPKQINTNAAQTKFKKWRRFSNMADNTSVMEHYPKMVTMCMQEVLSITIFTANLFHCST